MTQPTIKLIYLDQSFLSSACLESSLEELNILNKIIYLKNNQKARVIISEIHSRETSRIPDKFLKNSKQLWSFQNGLADGWIAADVDNVFVAQLRRVIFNNKELTFPISDIGLEVTTHSKAQRHFKLNNLWLQKIHRDQQRNSEWSNERMRAIFNRQIVDSSNVVDINDCLNYIRNLWAKDIINGIQNWIDYNNQLLKIEENLNNGTVINYKSLIEPKSFYYLINDVLNGHNNEDTIFKWRKLLKDTENLCSLVKIQSAFEAELLWKLKSNQSSLNSGKFHTKFGESRQSDINHISAFVPYVDILTTDNDMRNLCKSPLIANELNKFPCKIYSKSNYDELNNLLDEITKT